MVTHQARLGQGRGCGLGHKVAGLHIDWNSGGGCPGPGHEDAEQEVVAEGAEHEPVLVAVGLAQFVQESGWRINRENLLLGIYVNLLF